MKIKAGDTVRLKKNVNHTCPKERDNYRTAKVRAVLESIEGGIFLERDLRGCRYWNVNDLEKVNNNSHHQ